MKTKNKLFTLILAGAIIGISPLSFASSGGSELSYLSGSILLSPLLIPLSVLEELSLSSSNSNNYNNAKKMEVKTVGPTINGNVYLETQVNVNQVNQQVNFQIPEKAVKNCNIKAGTQINVQKNNAGYILNANDKVVGIVPNGKGKEYFLQEKK
jgi:hypothetical protein